MRAGERDKTAGVEETADQVAKRVSSFPFFGSGSGGIDGLLGGGYRAGTLTEVFGESNSGKTQLAMQASLLAARGGSRTLFIDTEGSFRPERMEQMAAARGWDIGGLLDRVMYVRSDSYSEQMDMVRGMGRRQATAPCKLVVVDTLTRNFSVELPGRANIASRQGALDVHLSEMARDAYLNGRAYVLTNRVTFGAFRNVSIGGRTVEQLVHASLMLTRDGGRVRATLPSTGAEALVPIGAAGVE
jgi:DNA repair protein RadA